MFRLRSKSGDESVFRSAEEIRSALLSGFVTPDAQIWDAELKGWVPLVEHALYQQIASAPGGRKSGSVKAPPAGPAAPKTPPKLVIKRPGATTAIPAVKPTVPPEAPAPPAAKAPAPPPPPPVAPPKPAASDDMPDLELIDLDLTPEPEVAAPAPVPPPPPRATPAAPAAPPKRPTPPPPPVEAPAPRVSGPRVSAPKPMPPEEPAEAPAFMRHTAEVATSGSKAGLIVAAVVVLAVVGGGYVMLRGKGAPVPAADTTAAVTPAPVAVPPVDTTRDTTQHAVADSAKHDSTAAAAPAPVAPASHVDSSRVAAAHPADTATPATGIEPVPFAPLVDRGPTSWNARPLPPQPLSVPALEVVRSRYAAAQARASAQFEASLEVAEFADMFDPAKVARSDARQAAFDAIDAARGALRDFRRKQAALDFAYTDSLRQALPPGSDTPDLRTFGPILRESPSQAALTDSIVGELVDMYGLLVSEAGGYTLKAGMLAWKDADNANQYRTDQEKLTAQLARLRTKSITDVPPAQAAILRGIGLPR